MLTEWRALLAGSDRDSQRVLLTERIREALGDTGVLEGDEEGQVNTRPARARVSLCYSSEHVIRIMVFKAEGIRNSPVGDLSQVRVEAGL